MLFVVVVVLFLCRRSVTGPPPAALPVSFCPVNQSAYTLLHWLPLAFFCPSFVVPQNGLCNSLSPRPSLSLFLLRPFLFCSICVPALARGRICVERALSLLNDYILVSVGGLERKLVRSGTLSAIRAAWFFQRQTSGTLLR